MNKATPGFLLIFAVLLLELAAVTPISAQENNEPKGSVTTGVFAQIRIGDSYEQVSALIGSPGTGEVDHRHELSEYEWESPNGARIFATFKRGVLVEKSQEGLDPDVSSAVTGPAYELLREKMTYEEASGMFGAGGNLVRQFFENGEVYSEYDWRGPDGARVKLYFRGGVLVDKTAFGLNLSKTNVSDIISIEQFSRIEIGMSYDKVKEIMGSEGNQTSMTKSGSYEFSTYEWKGEKFARISVRFTRSELSYKSQSGLTPSSGDADITQAKFNKIETGMSYDEVKGIIGSEGELTSLSKIGNYESASYRWKGPNYSNIFVNFRDDKLQNKTQSNLK